MSFFPADWPQPGPIDLTLHDLPHASSGVEWWYMNAHVTTERQRQASLFVAFFRVVRGSDPQTKQPLYGHFITWALSDLDKQEYHPYSAVDRGLPATALERLKAGKGTRDKRINRAMMEVLEKGTVPLPDRVLDGDIFVSQTRLHLDYAGQSLQKRDDGSYELQLSAGHRKPGVHLVFHPLKPPARHGDDGVVRGVGGEDMFYYFIPRCRVEGSVTLDGVDQKVQEASGWYDHEFGGHFRQKPAGDTLGQTEVAWDWASVQLEDGTDVSTYALYKCEDNSPLAHWTILVAPDGTRRAYTDMSFDARGAWRSIRTFHDYPTQWDIRVPEIGLHLDLKVAFEDQEIITVVSKPAFWEGRMEVTGTWQGKPVKGRGYLERSGFEPIRSLDEFFGAVSEEVRKSVNSLYPLQPSADEVMQLVSSEKRRHYMDGVDTAQVARTLIHPVRAITDRGGKAWRSYALLACCDVVLGDSRHHRKWLALPEFMHVGSLIVDDVEDRSDIRRGGPTSHKVYGEAIALNAGTAAYFMCQQLLRQLKGPDSAKVKLYDLYFEAMRAGHTGQALDLDGLSAVMPGVVESGDGVDLEQRILAIHRLKTAAPAGALARMGAMSGEGTDAQVEAVGEFFEALGLAFQVIDDVLNLRGFKGDLKTRGEDITHGKITMPVAKAMARMPLPERQSLWEALQARLTDPVKLSAVIEKLEACGAIDACAEQAREMVETAWRKADPVLPDSLYKVMLRAFGWYILERHY